MTALVALLGGSAVSACSGTPTVERKDDEVTTNGTANDNNAMAQGDASAGDDNPDLVFDNNTGDNKGNNNDTTGMDAGGPPDPVCGNGDLEDGEDCDDGNSTPADGCSGICTVEKGYKCPTPGEACEVDTTCGNQVIEVGETCDDGNNDLGDGCDTACMVEDGWACTANGCQKVDTSVCGDSAVGVGEQCDDGQDPPVAGDGCDADCQVEDGWQCRTPGEACEPILTEYCGNAAVVDPEECDDGNAKPGDGCSASCKVESGYVCPGGTDCAVECGDGLVVGAEACDDDNQADGDGCSADCSTVEEGFVCPIAAGVGGACVEADPGPVCPNAQLEFGEQCDDGNSTDGDGCTGCVIDPGYRCPKIGQLCEILPFCGDGYVDVAIGEQCDDGDMDSDDGCDSDCQVVPGWLCPVPVVNGNKLDGGDCRQIVCGDLKIEGSEQCDDGNTNDDDGCSSSCALEAGWTCPLNAACQAKDCGDGIVAGLEECDNAAENGTGTAVSGVICSSGCLVVADPAECGDGMPDPGEACDDGNNNLGDGCGIFCENEPACSPPTACTTSCGDGLKFDTEECDDGNTRNGDGCSSTCEVELGFVCNEVAGDVLNLPIVYRDFKAFQNGGHVAFQWTENDPIDETPEEDIWVRMTLGTTADTLPDGTSLLGKPIFKWYVQCDNDSCDNLTPDMGETQPSGTLDASTCNAVKGAGTGTRYINTDGRDSTYCGYGAKDFLTFSQWYMDVPGVNTTIRDTLTLTKDPMTGAYVFEDNSFFPIDGQGFGNEDWTHNFHFTSEVRYWFQYDDTADATLTFDGDDDVWVFVNGSLVVDISGTHGEITDSVTINPSVTDMDGNLLNLVDGGVYEIVVFQAERNCCNSNYRLTLQDFNLAPSVCQSVCGDGIKASNEQCDNGDGCEDLSVCTDGVCADDSLCNDVSYNACTPGPDPTTGCKLGPYCGDGITNGPEECDDGLNNSVYSDTMNGACAAGCVWAPYCGDGEVAVGIEQCDGGDDCEADCTLGPICGDGALDIDEECDDGILNGGVDSDCDIQCRFKCGNGENDAGEQCDPGAGNFSTSYDGCLPPVGDQPGCLLGPNCGDGIKNGPEECDDGLNDGSYGTCAPGCVLAPRCGDAVVQEPAGEICDEGDSNVLYTYKADGAGECTTACRPVGYCGDAAVTNGEGCDDGVNDNSPGSCTDDCGEWVDLPSCGNGNLDPGEECDDGELNQTVNSDCDMNCRIRCGNGIKDVALGEECDDGVNDGRYGTCNADCTLAPYCGDGSTDGPEQCDEGVNGNQSMPYGEGTCTTACTLGPYCGDGRIQTVHGEECDGDAGCGTNCLWKDVR